VSDGDDSALAEHLANMARRRAVPAVQPGTVTMTRARRFHGDTPTPLWLSAAWSPGGSQLALGGGDANGHGAVYLWNGETGHHESFSMRHLTHDVTGLVLSLAWSPDGSLLATMESDQKTGQPAVRVRSKSQGVRAIDMPRGLPVSQVAWSPDGSLLAVSGRDCGQTLLADPAGGAVRRVIDGISGPVAWQPGGRLLAGCAGTAVALFDPATGDRVRQFTGHDQAPGAIAWAGHGQRLAVAYGEHIRVWDVESGVWWHLPWATAEGDRGPDGTVTDVQWLDGGRYLVEFRKMGGSRSDEEGSTVSTLIIWDVETRPVLVQRFWGTVRHATRPVAAIAVEPVGRRCAVATDLHIPDVYQIDGDLPDFLH
jgi:WD40 repeat protein